MIKIIRKHLIVDGGIFLKNIKWIFVFYSIAAIASMCAIGVAVGMSSLTIAHRRNHCINSNYG